MTVFKEAIINALSHLSLIHILTKILLAMLELIQETAAYLKGRMHTQPETAIILGTGLGSLATEITDVYKRQALLV